MVEQVCGASRVSAGQVAYSGRTTKDGPGGATNAVIPVLTPDYTGGSL